MRIFIFHSIGDSGNPYYPGMHVSKFYQCIKYISARYSVIRLEDYLEHPNDYKHIKKLASVTFDDGFHDNYSIALPLLEKCGIKASFYVVTSSIDTGLLPWTGELDRLYLSLSDKKSFHKLFKDYINETNLIFKTKSFRYSDIKSFLIKINTDQREKYLKTIRQIYPTALTSRLMMNWDELRDLINRGHYVGSHTVSHPNLKFENDATFIEKELLSSREKIKSELGYSPITIAYPFGGSNELTKSMSKLMGYKFGLLTGQKSFSKWSYMPYDIPRIDVYSNENCLKTFMRLNFDI